MKWRPKSQLNKSRTTSLISMTKISMRHSRRSRTAKKRGSSLTKTSNRTGLRYIPVSRPLKQVKCIMTRNKRYWKTYKELLSSISLTQKKVLWKTLWTRCSCLTMAPIFTIRATGSDLCHATLAPKSTWINICWNKE